LITTGFSLHAMIRSALPDAGQTGLDVDEKCRLKTLCPCHQSPALD
jgi:hypothetical protein